jgi:plastocyanin
MPPSGGLGERVPDLPVPTPPPITPTMQAVLDKSVGFSAFVSYSENGFESPDVKIKKGDSVRFTNNSSHTLWISAVAKDGVMYPASGNTCGQSSFDSCVAMAPHEIWEFTFTEPGAWWYRNNSDQTHVGVIRVQ